MLFPAKLIVRTQFSCKADYPPAAAPPTVRCVLWRVYLLIACNRARWMILTLTYVLSVIRVSSLGAVSIHINSDSPNRRHLVPRAPMLQVPEVGAELAEPAGQASPAGLTKLRGVFRSFNGRVEVMPSSAESFWTFSFDSSSISFPLFWSCLYPQRSGNTGQHGRESFINISIYLSRKAR